MNNSEYEYNFDYEMPTNICPRCGKTYKGYPAISRLDNKTPICGDCGAKEAFAIFFGKDLNDL